MTLRWLAITCDAQRLLTKSQMWGKLWHATVQAGGWVGVRSGREKHLPGKTPQTAPPSQDLNVVNAATKVDPRAMAEPGSRYPEGDRLLQDHIFHMLSPPCNVCSTFDHPSSIRGPHLYNYIYVALCYVVKLHFTNPDLTALTRDSLL